MPDDRHWLRQTIELAKQCPPSSTAFAVGSVIVDEHGELLSTGFSRETGPTEHAEEVALTRLGNQPPTGVTLYSSLEPCSQRASKPRCCTELIIEAGIRRVVFAWREPDHFVSNAESVHMMRGHGLDVVEIPDLAEAARAVNNDVLSELPGGATRLGKCEEEPDS
ncbi:deaminase [Pseudonocardia phyllosphaerae]|uniref:deaminase n=1 Tax=Pseudonocardia phyllosphaerae TaxID=3390502 RepID=UPI00397AF6DE